MFTTFALLIIQLGCSRGSCHMALHPVQRGPSDVPLAGAESATNSGTEGSASPQVVLRALGRRD